MVSKIVIYVKDNCPYCTKAKALFNKKGLRYQEINVTGDEDLFNEMIKKSADKKTLPQIFINEISIGGCDDLYKIYEDGNLDILLKGE